MRASSSSLSAAEVHARAGLRYDAGAVAACERVFAQGFVFRES